MPIDFEVNNFEGCENVKRSGGGLEWGDLPTYTVYELSKFTNEQVEAAFAGTPIAIKLLQGFQLCKVVSNDQTLSLGENISP